MGGRWEDWPPARPIRVDGGIRAKSKRGAIGEQWWSRRFIEVLESYGMSGRLGTLALGRRSHNPFPWYG